jgi:hypothetical protein
MLLMSESRKEFSVKIPGKTIPEVFHRFELELLRAANGRAIKFNGQKLSAQALTSAIVLHFLDLAEQERDRVVDVYLARYAEMAGVGVQIPGSQAEPQTFSEGTQVPRPGKKKSG